MNKFGLWLKQEISRHDMNVTGLALRMGLAHTSVRAWIVGKAEPSPKSIAKLVGVLGVPADMIYEALGRIPPDEAKSAVQRRITQKMTGLPAEDLVLVEGLVESLKARRQALQLPPTPEDRGS